MTTPVSHRENAIGIAESLWIATAPITNYPRLDASPLLHATDAPAISIADVVVVGAGIAGLTTAYLLQTAGVRVAVLEKERIAQGVTGHTTAKVTALHTLIYDKLIGMFGEETARSYGQANLAGLETIAALTRQLHIECDFKRTSAYTFAESAEDRKKVEAEVSAALKLGLPASFVEQVPLPIPTQGAIMFSNQAQFHPRKYLLGLAEAFLKAGGQIYEDARVLKIDERGNGAAMCEIETSFGTLYADKVVIASHYPIYDPALYFTRLSPHRSCVIAATLDGVAPEGMFISSAKDGFSIRNQPVAGETLLLVGGEHYPTGQGGDILERYRTLEHYARAHFPVNEVRYHWATQDNGTLDHLPYIGKISPTTSKVYIATGFDGWGMTNGSAAGMILSDEILDRPNAWAATFNPNRFKPGVAAASNLVSEGVTVAKEFIGGWLPKPGLDDAEKLLPGEGMIVESSEGKLAVSRDEAGTLHAVSAVCTHLGCIVVWNNAEKSWDCPCHASRFAADGKVVHSPAVKDLKQVPLPVTS